MATAVEPHSVDRLEVERVADQDIQPTSSSFAAPVVVAELELIATLFPSRMLRFFSDLLFKDVSPIHKAQLLTHMKLLNVSLGPLFNSHEVTLVVGISRLILPSANMLSTKYIEQKITKVTKGECQG